MVLVFLVHFSALCSVVFTHTDSPDKGNSQTSFEFRDVERSDVSAIVSSFQKTLRCVKSEPSNLKLAAFNVRTFGTKKMATPGVPEILVKIILRYDVILIQEIRDSSGKAIVDLLSLVNKVCGNSINNLYSIIISPRLGRTSSKEQYAFLYRKDVLSVNHTYVYDDGKENLQNDTFEREPYIVHFTSTRTRISDFVLVAIHTSPSKANQEIQQLVAVYDDVIKQLAIPNVIILGDLNAACSYMSDRDWKTNHLANDKRFHWLISDCVDTTVNGGHCAYDRFIVAGDAMLNAAMESSSGSYQYDQHLNINKTMVNTSSFAPLPDMLKTLLERFSIKYRKTKTKVITLANHRGHRQSSEPIKTPSNYMKLRKSAGKRVRAALVSDHYPVEMQIYSKDLEDYSTKTVEYTFKMKQHPSLSRYQVYGMRKRKSIKAAQIAVETTYGTTAITRVTFRKDFGNLEEAMNALRDIKDIFLIANMVSIDQIQNAKFHLKGAWEKENQLLVKKPGAVKIVCETNPTTTCWIALLLT